VARGNSLTDRPKERRKEGKATVKSARSVLVRNSAAHATVDQMPANVQLAHAFHTFMYDGIAITSQQTIRRRLFCGEKRCGSFSCYTQISWTTHPALGLLPSRTAGRGRYC